MCEKHYWEINAKGTPSKLIEEAIKRHFGIIKSYRVKDNPYHKFYILDIQK